MLVEILFVLLVLAVAVLMAVDVVKTPSDTHHGLADRQAHDAERAIQAHDAERAITGAPYGPGAKQFRQEPAMTAIPAAVQGADPTRRQESVSPSGPDYQHSRTGSSAVQDRSGRGLRNWHVRSRLLLLVIIPTVTVTAVAFCVVSISNALRGAPIHSSGKVVLSALTVGALVLIVVATWFTIILVRSVLQPLHRLQARAREVTGVRLADTVRRISESNGKGVPSNLAPTDVDSSDEIGEVARAFDQMRREMVRLAVNEAALGGRLNAMFMNLSHRSQSLVERQIRLLENLEQGEQDAERLASLARMNRIATRMHRNSQNLLVLAGHEPSSGWNQPVTLVNVIRAAVSEIEGYERVSLNAQPNIAVQGPAVNDAVHLLAELIENATSFSAADMAVDVSGHMLTSGVLVDVTDRGIGMAAEEMAYANWLLENPSAADINVPKWMGLSVVARLAARHAIRVRLQPAQFGGLTALVWLPDEVITSAAPSPRPGGFHSAGPGPGLLEAAVDSGRAPAEQRATMAKSTEAVPGVSEASQFARAPVGAAAPVGQEASSAHGSLIMTPPEGLEGIRRLPIFDEVDSLWFSSGRKAPRSSGLTAAVESRWSSPADEGWRAAEVVDSPSSSGSTPAGLPRRMPNANLVPGVIAGTQPGELTRSADAARDRFAAFQQGVSRARSAPSGEVAAAGGQDGS